MQKMQVPVCSRFFILSQPAIFNLNFHHSLSQFCTSGNVLLFYINALSFLIYIILPYAKMEFSRDSTKQNFIHYITSLPAEKKTPSLTTQFSFIFLSEHHSLPRPSMAFLLDCGRHKFTVNCVERVIFLTITSRWKKWENLRNQIEQRA